jgi:hypothetical protein
LDDLLLRGRALYFPRHSWLIEVEIAEWDALHDRVLYLGARCQQLEAKNRELKALATETRDELFLRMTEVRRYEDAVRRRSTA